MDSHEEIGGRRVRKIFALSKAGLDYFYLLQAVSCRINVAKYARIVKIRFLPSLILCLSFLHFAQCRQKAEYCGNRAPGRVKVIKIREMFFASQIFLQVFMMYIFLRQKRSDSIKVSRDRWT